MTQSKIFCISKYSATGLEKNINDFLLENPNIKIITTTVVTHDSNCSLIIFYKNIKKTKILK